MIINLKEDSSEPQPDIAHCEICGWEGDVSSCHTEKDGDWESGYYLIHLCPNCEDGGCISDYSMSAERGREWCLWYENKIDEDSKEVSI